MKVFTIILLFYGIGCMASKTIKGPSNIYYAENEGLRQKRSAPNSTAIAALQTIRDLNVIRFYKALRELYLDDGFDVKLKFNAAILTAPVIPDIVYEEVIKSLELTRWEIKRGDGTMRRIQGMIKLNEPDSLIREPWLMDLVMLIMEKSVNPKNVAYSIRDLGMALMANGSTRTGYTNGTDLRQFLKTWELTELKSTTEQSSRFNWTETLLLIHHTIGPENFNALGDILESLPWQTFGVYPWDSEFLRTYKLRLLEAIRDTDVAKKLLTAMKIGFEDFGMKVTVMDRLAEAEILGLGSGASGTGSKPNRISRAQSSIASILKDEQLTQKLSSAIQKSGLHTYESVRIALNSGARLLNSMGTPELAHQKCLELKSMAESDPNPWEKIHHAIQVLRKLNGTLSNGKPAFEVLFDMYFEERALRNVYLFQDSRTKDLETMKAFFEAMDLSTTTRFPQVITLLLQQKPSLRKLRTLLSNLQNDQFLVRNFKKYLRFDTSEGNGKKLRAALLSLSSLSSSDSDLWDLLKSVKAIQSTSSPTGYWQALREIAPLTRDGKWMDFWESLGHVMLMTAGHGGQGHGPFQNIPKGHLEVFRALQSLLQDPEGPRNLGPMCTFILEFLGSAALGADPVEIARWNYESRSVDSLVELLRAAGNQKNLGRLLNYHKDFTTTAGDPRDSMAKIYDLIVFLWNNGWRQ